MKKITFLILIIVVCFSYSQICEYEVSVNIKNNEGQIKFAIYKGDNNFPEQDLLIMSNELGFNKFGIP